MIDLCLAEGRTAAKESKNEMAAVKLGAAAAAATGKQFFSLVAASDIIIISDDHNDGQEMTPKMNDLLTASWKWRLSFCLNAAAAASVFWRRRRRHLQTRKRSQIASGRSN